jgi:hypothetical protein
MLRKRKVSTAIGGVQKQRSCTDNLFVLTRILQEAGSQLCLCLDVRKAYDTVWRMTMVAEKVGWKGYGGSCET